MPWTLTWLKSTSSHLIIQLFSNSSPKFCEKTTTTDFQGCVVLGLWQVQVSTLLVLLNLDGQPTPHNIYLFNFLFCEHFLVNLIWAFQCLLSLGSDLGSSGSNQSITLFFSLKISFVVRLQIIFFPRFRGKMFPYRFQILSTFTPFSFFRFFSPKNVA